MWLWYITVVVVTFSLLVSGIVALYILQNTIHDTASDMRTQVVERQEAGQEEINDLRQSMDQKLDTLQTQVVDNNTLFKSQLTNVERSLKQAYYQHPLCTGWPGKQGLHASLFRMDVEKMTVALHELTDILVKHDVKYYAAFGTALGLTREGGFIAHDHDVDLGVSVYDWYTIYEHVVFEAVRAGFLLVDHWPEYNAALLTEESLDGDCARPKRFGFWRDYQFIELFLQTWMPPTEDNHALGFAVPVPMHPEMYLEDIYGPGWKTPNPSFGLVADLWKPEDRTKYLACAMPLTTGMYHQHLLDQGLLLNTHHTKL